MRLFQKAKRLGVWDPQALDFSADGADWTGFDGVEQDFLLRTLALFQAGEEGVTDVLRMFQKEIELGLALLGCSSPDDVSHAHVR